MSMCNFAIFRCSFLNIFHKNYRIRNFMHFRLRNRLHLLTHSNKHYKLPFPVSSQYLHDIKKCIKYDTGSYCVDSFKTTSYGSNVRSAVSSPSIWCKRFLHALIPSSFASNDNDVIVGTLFSSTELL